MRRVETAFTRFRKVVKKIWGWDKRQLPERKGGFYELNIQTDRIEKPKAYGKLTNQNRRAVIFDSSVAGKAENSKR